MSSATIRSAVLARAVRSLSALDGVDAIYLSGSLAEKTEDQYSDIDLRVVVADVAYESVRAQREQLPTTWGPFLFHQTVADNLTVTYYDSLTKADVFYYPASSISPSPWYNLGTEILFERSGALRAIIKASEGLEFTGTANEVVSHIQKCIAGLAESAKRARRGETIYASRLSAEAVHNLFIADDLMSHRAPLGSSKRESLVPGSLSTLAKSHLAVPSDADASQYFSDLSSATLELVNKAAAGGFCSEDTAARLTAALEQLILLSTGK
jgi:hypothetical protein